MKRTLTSKALPAQHREVSPANVIAASDLKTLPSSSGEILCDPLEDIRVRAETVSKLLKEIMDRGATRHWGINE
jgi:hypothetical protein